MHGRKDAIIMVQLTEFEKKFDKFIDDKIAPEFDKGGKLEGVFEARGLNSDFYHLETGEKVRNDDLEDKDVNRLQVVGKKDELHNVCIINQKSLLSPHEETYATLFVEVDDESKSLHKGKVTKNFFGTDNKLYATLCNTAKAKVMSFFAKEYVEMSPHVHVDIGYRTDFEGASATHPIFSLKFGISNKCPSNVL